eukprot:gnl/MRDRNA2_/MRDRNA2_31294_c0_seq1.p1 gnl/MRDRNA2_/MRDRNA2_31294_c0~~gnl/MRDRNA2_/MRDRNA2_31294_c0_seq1.p1  ORF type:complete len:388 (+),score=68.74 gnl/MRDRNA2_/MRDRNA2_31294_c0_seq1:71-1234(+)
MADAEALQAELESVRLERDKALAAQQAADSEAQELKKKLEACRAEKSKSAGISSAPVTAGCIVRISGLKDASHLNNTEATAVSWDGKKARWKVKLQSGELRLLKPENMRSTGRKETQDEDFKFLNSFEMEIDGELPPDAGSCPYKLWPMIHSGFIRVQMPESVMRRLNKDLDMLYNDFHSPSHAPYLQGEMKSGKQLTIQKPPDDYVKILLEACNTLAKALLESEDFVTELDVVWSVHQLERDYNPVHFHSNSKAYHGFSSFLHLKLPPQLNPENHQKPAHGAHGRHDGTTSFFWKADMPTNRGNLILPGTIECPLEIGHLYVFPQWLQHYVWPFEGPGERRTIAGNVALLFNPELAARNGHLAAVTPSDPGDPRGSMDIYTRRHVM